MAANDPTTALLGTDLVTDAFLVKGVTNLRNRTWPNNLSIVDGATLLWEADVDLYLVTLTAGRTITLPEVSGEPAGRMCSVKAKSLGGQTLTIDTGDGSTIDGAASITITVDNDYVEMVMDGTSWRILSDTR